MTPLARRLRAHRERGSALFITVMVITVLTAIGIFSMHAASLADQASGFNRQGVQTTYVAEFGARAVSAEIVGREQHYFQTIAAGTDDCRNNASLEGLVPGADTLPCYKLQTSEVWRRVDDQFAGNVGSSSRPELVGGLSSSGLEGAFIVEMTDLARVGAPIAGEDAAQDQFKFMQVQLTATGQVRPGGGEDGVCSAAFASTSGLSSVRAQITFGPVF